MRTSSQTPAATSMVKTSVLTTNLKSGSMLAAEENGVRDCITVTRNVANLFKLIEIEKIEKISNWDLVRNFTEVQASGDYEVVELYHATDAKNLYSIARNNFNLNKIKRKRYGKGMSFSKDCQYCNYYSNAENGEDRVFIVCDVLVGNSRIVKPYPKPEVPSSDIDTYISKDKKVYVKFNMRHVYPKYAVHYYEQFSDSDEYDDTSSD